MLLPVPENLASFQEVTVAGSSGLALSSVDGQGSSGHSALLSAMVDGSGYWNTNLGNARTADLQQPFLYSAGGDQVTLTAVNGRGCAATRTIDTGGDSPAPPLSLAVSRTE